MKSSLAIGCLAALIVGSSAVGELVYFARGGQAQLPASSEGDQIRLETPDGSKVFPRSDFLAIVPGHRVEEEWPIRRDAASQAGTVGAKFAAAWWALENGLTDHAIAALGELRPLAMTHEPTRRAILGLDSFGLPCPDPDLEPLKSRLRPLRFRELRSDHVVLLHQLGDGEALERLDVLERVVRTFTLAFATQGLELTPLRSRLVSVYLAERRDYAQFLRASDAHAFVDTQGYYHPTLRAVFAFDTRDGEAQKSARRAIGNRRRDGASTSDLARMSLLLDLDWRGVDLGIAAHETVHQLTVETGLAPHFDDFPTWLHEGLAAQFEVVRGGRWAGFGRSNDLRLPDWRSIHPAPRLAPLLLDNGFGQGYRRDVYAESWALVYYLRKAHPREFLTFLDLLRAPVPIGSAKPDRSFEAFRKAFGGDLATLEVGWHLYIADLKTPLETGRPSAAKSQLVGADPSH